MLLLVGFDYNETGNVFFNYQKNSGTLSSHYIQAFISGESKIFKNNGLYAYYYFIADSKGADRRAGVFHLDMKIPDEGNQKIYTLPNPNVRLFYIEKQKGKVIFQGDFDAATGWITVTTNSSGNELDSVAIKYSITLPSSANAATVISLNNGFISSTAVDQSYREEHKTENEDYYEPRSAAAVSCYDDDPYEDDLYAEEEEDSGCAGDPDNSGVDDDASSSSCSGDPEDEDEDNGGCGESDDLEASSSFMKRKEGRRFKKIVRFFAPFLVLTSFIFFLRRRKRVI